jgi:hypothetical protein
VLVLVIVQRLNFWLQLNLIVRFIFMGKPRTVKGAGFCRFTLNSFMSYYLNFASNLLGQFQQRIEHKTLTFDDGSTINVISFGNDFSDTKDLGGYMPSTSMKVVVNSRHLVGYEETTYRELLGSTVTIDSGIYRIDKITKGDLVTDIYLIDENTK